MSFSNIRSFENVCTPDELATMLQESEGSFLCESYSHYNYNNLDDEHQTNIIKKEVYSPILLSNKLQISTEEYVGPYNFHIEIDPHHGNKSPWVYSSPLNKLFILIDQKFPIDFKITGGEDQNLYVRATPVYAYAQHAQEIVRRCITHSQPSNKSNLGLTNEILPHIIRCHNKEVWYVGNQDDDKYLSVIVPLGKPQTACSSVRHIYEFVCKNSCSPGMDRRPIFIVFTLENDIGQIFGRKAICIRICSCPKRDKEKEEAGCKRKENKSDPTLTKRVKVEKKSDCSSQQVESKIYEISLKIPGKENAKQIYEMSYNIIAGCILRNKEPFQTCLQDLQEKIDQFNE